MNSYNHTFKTWPLMPITVPSTPVTISPMDRTALGFNITQKKVDNKHIDKQARDLSASDYIQLL